MKKNSRYLILFIGIFLIAVFFGGCANRSEEAIEERKEEVHIPMILTVDSSTGKKNEQELVDAFNQAYQGTYQVDVEWVLETEEEYRRNLKRLNVTDKLPAVITDLRMLPSFYQMMIEDERIVDLSPYLEEDEEWQQMIEPTVLEGCTESDGKVYLSPIITAVFSCSGVFWNQELFAQAGIESFPETWEEFWECCNRLKAHGITPLALHTEGTAWAPMLFATAELADSEEGLEFMKKLYPESYQNENGLRLANTLKKLFSYTTEDTMHTDFDVAYNNFFSGKAAMIPNGYWMIDQIPDEWTNKVRFSSFPGNVMISSPETFGWSIVSRYSEEIKEAAVEFLKFRTKMNQEKKQQLLMQDPRNTSRVELDYIQAYQNNPKLVPNYQVKWNSILQEETLGEYLPPLVEGKITVEEFVSMEDESIQQFENER